MTKPKPFYSPCNSLGDGELRALLAGHRRFHHGERARILPGSSLGCNGPSLPGIDAARHWPRLGHCNSFPESRNLFLQSIGVLAKPDDALGIIDSRDDYPPSRFPNAQATLAIFERRLKSTWDSARSSRPDTRRLKTSCQSMRHPEPLQKCQPRDCEQPSRQPSPRMPRPRGRPSDRFPAVRDTRRRRAPRTANTEGTRLGRASRGRTARRPRCRTRRRRPSP